MKSTKKNMKFCWFLFTSLTIPIFAVTIASCQKTKTDVPSKPLTNKQKESLQLSDEISSETQSTIVINDDIGEKPKYEAIARGFYQLVNQRFKNSFYLYYINNFLFLNLFNFKYHVYIEHFNFKENNNKKFDIDFSYKVKIDSTPSKIDDDILNKIKPLIIDLKGKNKSGQKYFSSIQEFKEYIEKATYMNIAYQDVTIDEVVSNIQYTEGSYTAFKLSGGKFYRFVSQTVRVFGKKDDIGQIKDKQLDNEIPLIDLDYRNLKERSFITPENKETEISQITFTKVLDREKGKDEIKKLVISPTEILSPVFLVKNYVAAKKLKETNKLFFEQWLDDHLLTITKNKRDIVKENQYIYFDPRFYQDITLEPSQGQHCHADGVCH
ncbi:hypothetical protein [Ureaplasma canigenitalium]|uniref:hypothetical protein n=1 Tax=Ureaplasma canigenitalium TaxID=42092 RepID=UPI0004E266C4|nr:hypothetical protein [Ureaplasma canigenitalium]